MTDVIRPVRASFWRALSDRNPFYLLSAACMLFGCVALTNSSSWVSIKVQRLLILIVTLNLYELLLIGLALFLIVRRGLRRDGTILLILEAFFLVDVTFLNSEIFSADLTVGLIVNLMLLLLAVLKVGAIFRGLGISLASGAFAVTVIELAMLFALPGVYRRIASTHNGALPPTAIYAAWWVLGLMPVLATVLMRDRHYFPEPMRASYRRNRHIVGLLVILPVVSLLAHACTSNWVYNVRWYAANVSPLILGLAVAIGGYDTHVSTLGRRMKLHFALPIVAIALAMQFPSQLVFDVRMIPFSPLRCTLLGAMLVYGYGFIVHRHILFAWAACMCLGSAGIGMSARQILDNLNLGVHQTFSVSKRVWPRTVASWGIISVVASFVLLVLGALISLRKPAQVELIEDSIEPRIE